MKTIKVLLQFVKRLMPFGNLNLKLSIARANVRTVVEIEGNIRDLLRSGGGLTPSQAEVAVIVESLFQRTQRCMCFIDQVLEIAQSRLTIFAGSPPQEALKDLRYEEPIPYPSPSEIITISQAAIMWKCSRGTIYSRVHAGKLTQVIMPTGKRKGVKISDMERVFGPTSFS